MNNNGKVDAMNSNGTALTFYDNGTATQANIAVGTVQYWPYPDNTYWPWSYPYNVQITYPTTPFYCLGDVHVFGCEHADKCKCGKASRTPEPKKCGACGK